MSRLPQRSSAIQSGANPENGSIDRASPATEPAKVALGWRLAILVWVGGFSAIFGYELWNLLWQLVTRMF